MNAWPRVWDARWIRFEPPPPERGWYETRPRPRDSFGFYRRVLRLDAVPVSVPCRITADGRYVLLVNGMRAGAGPVRCEPAHLTYDEYELAPMLQPGANVLAIFARHYGGPSTHFKPAPPMGELGFGCVLLQARAGGVTIGTDESWRALRAPYVSPDLDWPEGPPPIEIVDARELPAGWERADFDDSAWPAAHVLAPGGLGITDPRPPAGPYGPIAPRPIGPMLDRMRRPAAGTGTRFDFGAIVLGHPIVELDADPGSVVEIACGEETRDDGSVIVAPRGWSMQVVAAGIDGERVEAFEPVGFRYAEVAVRSGAARRIGIEVRERHYPRGPGAFFRCNDPMLTELWETAARTVDLCSMDAIVDCPGREQRAWLGDQSVTGLVSLVCNADPRLAIWTQRLHAQGARADGLLPMVAAGDFTDRSSTIPDFSLHWVSALANLHRYTGFDCRDLLPVAQRALAFFERFRSADGCIEALPGWVFVDWAQTARGQSVAAVDALYALALGDFAGLCDAFGRPVQAVDARERAARTREAFQAYWDEQRGVYVDAAGKRRVSQQTNALAIVSGCAPRRRWTRMLERITQAKRLVRTKTPGDPGSFAQRLGRQWQDPEAFDDGDNVVEAQPFLAHFLHRAFALAGRRDALLASLKRWRGMLERGNGCLEEYWDAAPGLGSRCHAWSATPAYDLSTYVLGIAPSSAGFSTVRIQPYLGELEWAEGAVPTPHGAIHVRIEPERVRAELPDGVTGSLHANGETRDLNPGVTTWEQR
ncbi:MAG: alpha-L-rhamnosidase C-terminal domain-containing protein [Actinomycetota bacterium]